MGFVTQTGYSLPGGDLPLEHARILHANNRARIKSVAASSEASSAYPAASVDNGLTFGKWRPFLNDLTAPNDFGDAVWTAAGVTVGADGRTVTEDTSTGNHRVTDGAVTLTATEHVFGVVVQRQTAPEVLLTCFDGAATFTCYFDLRDGTVGTASGATGQVVDLGGGEFLCSMYFTPAAGSGSVSISLSNGSEIDSYTGDGASSVKLIRASVHPSAATLRLDTFTPGEADLFCIAAHNLGSGAGRIAFEHDSDGNDIWTALETITPADNSPIMLMFVPVVSDRWRITIDRCMLPEIGVVRVGKALQMERMIHTGVSPMEGNRDTVMRGNLSEAGEVVGRSKLRSKLSGSFRWATLTYSFCQTSLIGRGGLIEAMEEEPCFIAWRPGTYPDGVYYAWTNQPLNGPTFNQRPNLMAFQMPLVGYQPK